MTYKEFHNTVVGSKPDDWRFNGERYIFLPNIDIALDGNFYDGDVPELEYPREEIKRRFGSAGGYAGTSRYKLFYRGEFVTGSNLVSVGRSDTPGSNMIPYPFGFTTDFQGEPVRVSQLDYKVCYLLSNLFGGDIGKDEYDKLLESADVHVVPYEDGIWYLGNL